MIFTLPAGSMASAETGPDLTGRACRTSQIIILSALFRVEEKPEEIQS